MDVIDGKWIAARLGKSRGAKAALADAMGVGQDVVSKILNGKRRVQPEEIPRVLAYFDEPATEDDVTHRLLARIELLTEQEREFLLAAAEGMIARHRLEDQ